MSNDVIIKKSRISKKGVFAARDFKKSEIVLEWNPKILEEAEVEQLESSQRHYIFKVDKGRYFLMQSPEKYVNHSCEPNTIATDKADIATEDIKRGEEITSDYGGHGIVEFKCACGSKKCQGVIN